MFRLSIIGNLGADAEVRETNGVRFVSLSIAHTDTRNGASETIWVSCTLNYCSQNLFQYLRKGQKVYACGNGRLRSFKGRDGNYHAGVDLRIDYIALCGGGIQDKAAEMRQDELCNNNKQTEKEDEEKPF